MARSRLPCNSFGLHLLFLSYLVREGRETLTGIGTRENIKIQEVIEKQVLTLGQAVEDKLDEEIAALKRLDVDNQEALRERRLQQMKMAEKRNRWISFGHGDYTEVPSEKDFFFILKAGERVVCRWDLMNLVAPINLVLRNWRKDRLKLK